jgi:hypothetical protein
VAVSIPIVHAEQSGSMLDAAAIDKSHGTFGTRQQLLQREERAALDRFPQNQKFLSVYARGSVGLRASLLALVFWWRTGGVVLGAAERAALSGDGPGARRPKGPLAQHWNRFFVRQCRLVCGLRGCQRLFYPGAWC